MYRNKIHFYKPVKPLTLVERAEFAFELLYNFSRLSNHTTWMLSDKKKIDLSDKSSFLKEVLFSFKSRINKYTTSGEVSDDYLDPANSVLSFYGSKALDDGVIIQEILTPDEIEFIVFNYDEIVNAENIEKRDKLISNFTQLTSLQVFNVT